MGSLIQPPASASRSGQVFVDQLHQWQDNIDAAPAHLRPALIARERSRAKATVVHEKPETWDDLREDIADTYVRIATEVFSDAEALFVVGSRITGRWRDADDPRCACNGGIMEQCPSDWDIHIIGLDGSVIRERIKEWNDTHAPAVKLDYPNCNLTNAIEIPKALWKND